jgi:integrase/recombinase XerD
MKSNKEKTIKINLNNAILKFLYVKRVERRAPKTIKAYQGSLEQFAKWYELSGKLCITREVVRAYIHYLTYEKVRWDDHPTSPNGEVGLSARTVNNNIRNLKIFFNYLLQEKQISFTPMDGINYQREESDSFEVFTDEDIHLILSAPNCKVYTGFRDYTMMLVLCDCGLRVKELTNIKVRDVDFNLQHITIEASNAKNKKKRVVPVSEQTADALLTLRQSINIEDNDYLFLTQFGERYYGDTFAKMLKLYAKRVGVTGPRVSPHTFRHFFAVKYLREGGDPISLMRLLGHSSFNTTEKYVRYSANHLKEQHQKASPVKALGINKPRTAGKKIKFKW